MYKLSHNKKNINFIIMIIILKLNDLYLQTLKSMQIKDAFQVYIFHILTINFCTNLNEY